MTQTEEQEQEHEERRSAKRKRAMSKSKDKKRKKKRKKYDTEDVATTISLRELVLETSTATLCRGAGIVHVVAFVGIGVVLLQVG